MTISEAARRAKSASPSPPRVGFLGTGWIGRNRMQAMVAAGAIKTVAVADPSSDATQKALTIAPGATAAASLDDLLDIGVDAVVIATPSALHATQAIHALERGAAVFCQKPLGRTMAEVAAVVETARAADRLLGVDLSYRFTEGMQGVRAAIAAGELGKVHAADLVFHNAYGPDKPWFYEPELSGGGCLIDLGVHLVDLALWVLGFPKVAGASGALFAKGRRLGRTPTDVEDYVEASIELDGGRIIRLACSWGLHAGCDAVISAAFHGDKGGALFHNVGGSFYAFEAELFRGPHRRALAGPPDAWGGRAGCEWARRLSAGERFDLNADQFIEVARILDLIYGR